MSFLRNTLDKISPHVSKGAKYEKWYALYEAVDTFFYSPADVNKGKTHVRDGIDLKRVMIYVFLAALPCVMMGSYNVGFQANEALEAAGLTQVPGWRGDILSFLGFQIDSTSILSNFAHGFWYWFPIYVVTFVTGIVWEVLFCTVRGHEVNEVASGCRY